MENMKKGVYVVEIQADEEHRQRNAIEHHPLTEICNSPGHLLLLKLWQREEFLQSRRIASKESRLDSTKQEIFHLCYFFLLFHGIFAILLFTSSVNKSGTCGKWWIPAVLSLATSVVFVLLVQIKVLRYWEVWGRLGRVKGEGRTIARFIQELRMKGSSFDLSKEINGGKKMKSSSVEVKWKPVEWISRYKVTISLVVSTGLVFPISKLLFCL